MTTTTATTATTETAAARYARPLPDRLTRESYAPLTLYAPTRPPVRHDLSDNTNQWGAPPSALAALAALGDAALQNYPPQPTSALIDAISAYTRIADTGAIATGNGSDDIIDCAMRALAAPGDRIALMWPTFTMIPYFARTNGVIPVPVMLKGDWDADADALLAARARITYLCAPNNPTGTRLARATVQRVIDEAEGVVLLDEAYAEYASDSWIEEAPTHGRLIVTRTLSKAFGLAGLRVGYAVGAPELLHEIEKARGPYKITTASSAAATAALTNDVAWMRARAHEATVAREWLYGALRGIGLTPLPSDANFLLVPMPGAARVAERLAEQGLLIRAFSRLPLVGDALRITVAPMDVMKECVELLRDAAT